MLLTKFGHNFSLRKSPSKSKSIQYFLQSVGSFGQAVSEEGTEIMIFRILFTSYFLFFELIATRALGSTPADFV